MSIVKNTQELNKNKAIFGEEVHREIIKNELELYWCKIIFEKVNGEIRTMKCTLNPDLVDYKYKDKAEARPAKNNPDVCRVFDIDKKQWRSFRYDNLIMIESDIEDIDS